MCAWVIFDLNAMCTQKFAAPGGAFRCSAQKSVDMQMSGAELLTAIGVKSGKFIIYSADGRIKGLSGLFNEMCENLDIGDF